MKNDNFTVINDPTFAKLNIKGEDKSYQKRDFDLGSYLGVKMTWLRLTLLALTVIAALYLNFMPMNFSIGHLKIGHFYDGMHFPAGLILGFLIGITAPIKPIVKYSVLIKRLLLILALTVSLEALQKATGRSATLHDWWVGFLGSGLGFFCILCYRLKKKITFFIAFILCLTLVTLYNAPSFLNLYSPTYREQHFPNLGMFETPVIERYLWSGTGYSLEKKWLPAKLNMTQQWSSEGYTSLLIKTHPGYRQGARFTTGEISQDWSTFNYLSFDLYLPSEDAQKHEWVFIVDIMDHRLKYPFMLRQTFQVLPGKNQISIPLNSNTETDQFSIEWQKIKRLSIYTHNDPAPNLSMMFGLDNIRLEI